MESSSQFVRCGAQRALERSRTFRKTIKAFESSSALTNVLENQSLDASSSNVNDAQSAALLSRISPRNLTSLSGAHTSQSLSQRNSNQLHASSRRITQPRSALRNVASKTVSKSQLAQPSVPAHPTFNPDLQPKSPLPNAAVTRTQWCSYERCPRREKCTFAHDPAEVLPTFCSVASLIASIDLFSSIQLSSQINQFCFNPFHSKKWLILLQLYKFKVIQCKTQPCPRKLFVEVILSANSRHTFMQVPLLA